MNTFGHSFRLSIFGESHGDCVGVVIDGCPAGLSLSPDDLRPDIERRKPAGPARDAAPRAGRAGDPQRRPERQDDGSSPDHRLRQPERPVRRITRPFATSPGPGTPTSSPASSSEASTIPGAAVTSRAASPCLWSPPEPWPRSSWRPRRLEAVLLEAGGSTDIEEAVRAAAADGDSVGGLIECRGSGFPAGLGEPFFDSVESLIAHAVLAIPGVIGHRVRGGFRRGSRMRGSACNDVPVDPRGTTRTNHSGGINGGITNGNEIVFRAAVKPPSSIRREQESVDLGTGLPVRLSVPGRHDACIALRMPVVVEAAAAVVLADLMLRQQLLSRIAR